MGSKRKLAEGIVDEILMANPNAKYFYDLFGGGGAISFEMLQRRQIKQVHYNELNTGVVNLLKEIQANGINEKMLEFVDRETYDKHKKGDDWYSGFCKTIYSFGSNQKGYLFGKDVEPIKKLAHEIVVYKNEESFNELSKILDINLPKELLSLDKTSARLLLSKTVRNFKKDRFELEQLERLQQLERLEQLEQLEISNLSYNEVIINTPINETIIYLDPPYENTREYQEDSFNHRELERWINDSPYKIYVSSYHFNLPLIRSFEHTSSLSAISTNKVVENLYCNQEHKSKYKFNSLF